MAKLFRRMGDDLKNGTVLGGLFGLAISIGDRIKSAVTILLPESLKTFAGSFSVPIIMILLGVVAGYYIDRY